MGLDIYLEKFTKPTIDTTKTHTSDELYNKGLSYIAIDGNYQITSFTHDNDQPIYVTWRATDNDESINKNQSITKGKTPNGKVLQITIVNENA